MYLQEKSIIRFTNIDICTHDFYTAIEELRNTEYKIGSKNIEAPEFTDCITAVRYILEKSSNILLPLVYIGSMPKRLLLEGVGDADIVDVKNAKAGDLIFFYHYSTRFKEKMVTHVGIFLNKTQYFHSSSITGGTISSISEECRLVATGEEMLLSEDPRRRNFFSGRELVSPC